MNKKFMSRHSSSFHERGVEVVIILLIVASVAAIFYSVYTTI